MCREGPCTDYFVKETVIMKNRMQVTSLFIALAIAVVCFVGCKTDKSKAELDQETDAATEQTTSGFEQAGEGLKEGFEGIGNTIESGTKETFSTGEKSSSK